MAEEINGPSIIFDINYGVPGKFEFIIDDVDCFIDKETHSVTVYDGYCDRYFFDYEKRTEGEQIVINFSDVV